MLKKLIMLAMVVVFLCVAIEASATHPVVVVVGTASGATGGAVWLGFAAAAFGPPILFSPYLWQYHKHPECRKEPSIGDMVNCIQNGPVKK
jgi:hypothetical protein